MMPHSHAHTLTFRGSAPSEAPTLFQAANTASLNLDTVLQIPPGVQAPELKRFYAIAFANQMPSEQDYQNLVAEYQNLVIHLTNLQQLYNQLIVSGDYIRALQIGRQQGSLIPMKCFYTSAIQWYNEQKSGQ